jgi:O-antigen biosynthesis protein
VIDMSARNTASIVICTHSEARLPLLRQSLKSVLDQQDGPYDVIVVIDHNPGLLATVAAEFAGVQVVANSHAQGLSGARNTGVGVARGDIVAFLDDDALAPPDWMARLQAHYGDRSVIGVGGRIDAVWTNGRPSWFAREFDWVVGCSYLGLPETPGPVRNLIGCNMSFRRAIFSMVGSFPEGQGRSGDNGAGCEETDFCIRAGSAFPGARIIYDPGIAVRHVLSRHRQTWSYFLRRCVQEGRSKAHLTTTLGARSGLATERQYLRRTLPKGVWRGLCDPFRLDWTGPLRSTAILLGLAGVGWGYALGRLKKTDGPRVQDNFAPIRIVEVDLDGPRVGIKAVDAKTGQRYGGAFCAVRSGGELVDLVEVPLYGVNLPADALSEVLARTRRTMVPAEVRPAPPPPDSFARIVIATRDRPDSLAKCLDSLLAQSHQNFEIVVVDNCPSSAATRDLIATYYAGTGRIHYRREDRAGLGHAHNAGLLGNAAGVVAFTDDDVRVDSRWLSALLRNFVGSERVGCVTGLILPAELETRRSSPLPKPPWRSGQNATAASARDWSAASSIWASTGCPARSFPLRRATLVPAPIWPSAARPSKPLVALMERWAPARWRAAAMTWRPSFRSSRLAIRSSTNPRPLSGTTIGVVPMAWSVRPMAMAWVLAPISPSFSSRNPARPGITCALCQPAPCT